jgi:hypothetical protein
MATRAQQPLTIERLERAMVLLAYMIELDGPVHMPAYECLEQELHKMRHRETVRDRARQRLEAIGNRPLAIDLKAKGK